MPESHTPRQVLSLSPKDQRVLPGTPTRFVGKPYCGAMLLEQIFVYGFGASRASDWVVNDIEIDGVSQLTKKDLPGFLFVEYGVVRPGRHVGSRFQFYGLLIESESEVAVTVAYVGLNPEGAVFDGSVWGGIAPQRPTQLVIASKDPIQREQIVIALDEPMRINMLEIDSGEEGAGWMIEDVRVDGTSQYCQSGPLPGDMFAVQSIDGFVSWQEGKIIEIDVKYTGLELTGERFIGRLVFDETRDTSKAAPPDVRATIQYKKFHEPIEETVVHCDWRPPWRPPQGLRSES
jgi:hypothetical protein